MEKDVQVKYVNTKQPIEQIKSKWWAQPKDEVYRHVFGVVNAIEQNQSYRSLRNIQYARLYSNMDFKGFYGTQFSRTLNPLLSSNRVTLNVIKACVDTAGAKIAKNKPKPLFLTDNGDWSQQTKAKNLTKYVEGLFHSEGVYEKAQQIFTDGAVWGTGCLKIFKDEDYGQVKVERVLIDEIKVDDSEGMYGEPRQIHQTKYIHREVLADMFPEYRVKIYSATGGIKDEGTQSSSADMIKVIESWHLPSGDGAKDGKHAISIENETLFEEEYTKNYFPFVFWRWSPRLFGFFGSGIPEEIRGIQIEINKHLINIQRAQHLQSHPKWLVENSSKVNTAHLNNENGGIIKFTGTPPESFVPPAMSAEIYQHVENLYNKAFEIVGITQLSATGRKPSGLDSGVALREYNDIESERFVLAAQRYEQMFLDIAKIAIDLSRDLYKDNKKLEVKVKGKKFIETIRWKDVDLDEDKYVMTVFPVSQLPSTPAGKLQFVQELIQSGFVDPEYAISLLDFPDLDSYVNIKTASLDDTRMLIEKMIEEGEYQSPEPYINLEYALYLTQSSYLRAKMRNVPEERLELLRRFMDECQAMIGVAAAPPIAEPIAEPEAPPTSDLLPAVA